MLFASGVLYIKYVESVIALLSKDRSQQNFTWCTLSDCSLTQTNPRLVVTAADPIGDREPSQRATPCLLFALPAHSLQLENQQESKEHIQEGTTGEQHHGKAESLQFSPEDTFWVELCVFQDESQPCIFLLSEMRNVLGFTCAHKAG